MAGSVVINPVSVPVVPGQMAVTTVRIRNTGTVVDQYTVSLVGQPAAWTTVAPAMISLFPGAEGTVDLHIAPPRAPGVGYGTVPFGVRVVASEDDDQTTVEEAEVDLRSFVDVTAKLTPRNSEGKRKAHHQIVLDNRGNTAVDVEIEASDPDEHLAFEVRPRTASVDAGATARVSVNVAARTPFGRGMEKHRPFSVTATPAGGVAPISLDGTMVQKPTMPKFLFPLVALAMAAVVLALILPGMLKPKTTPTNLQTADTTTTTEAPPPEEPVEDPAAAAAEAKAAAEAELAANGQDPNAPPPETTTPGGSGGGTSTTVSSSSQTKASDFLGSWVNVDPSKSPDAFRITTADNVFRIDLESSSTTPVEDANDGTIVFTTSEPAERHTMSISRDGKLVDVVSNSTDASKNRTMTFVKR